MPKPPPRLHPRPQGRARASAAARAALAEEKAATRMPIGDGRPRRARQRDDGVPEAFRDSLDWFARHGFTRE